MKGGDAPLARTRRPFAAELLVCFCLWVLGIAVGAALGRVTGLGPQEPGPLDAMQRVAQAVGESAGGSASLGSGLGSILASSDAGALVTWLGGYALAVGKSLSAGDLLSWARLGPLLVGAAALPLTYETARIALGRRAALVAPLVLACTPRFMHELPLVGADAPRAALWLLVLAPTAALASGRWRRAAGGVLAGVLFALAVAADASVAPVACVAAAGLVLLRGRSFLAELRRGRVALPTAAVWMALLGLAAMAGIWSRLVPNAFDLASPVLVRLTSPVVLPTFYAGAVVSSPPVPLDYSVWWLLSAVPAPTWALVAAGGLAFALGSRRSADEGEAMIEGAPDVASLETGSRRAADRSLGALLGVALVYLCAVAPFAPAPLLRFPPSAGVALPWVAIAAARGVEALAGAAKSLAAGRIGAAIATRLSPAPLARGLLIALACGPGAWAIARGPTTLAAYRSALVGGVRAALEPSSKFLGADSTIASLAAGPLDRLGRSELSLFAPGVPAAVWTDLRALGRLRTAVRAASTALGADAALWRAGDGQGGMLSAPGAPPGGTASAEPRPPRAGAREIGRVERAGMPLLSVYDLGSPGRERSGIAPAPR